MRLFFSFHTVLRVFFFSVESPLWGLGLFSLSRFTGWWRLLKRSSQRQTVFFPFLWKPRMEETGCFFLTVVYLLFGSSSWCVCYLLFSVWQRRWSFGSSDLGALLAAGQRQRHQRTIILEFGVGTKCFKGWNIGHQMSVSKVMSCTRFVLKVLYHVSFYGYVPCLLLRLSCVHI